MTADGGDVVEESGPTSSLTSGNVATCVLTGLVVSECGAELEKPSLEYFQNEYRLGSDEVGAIGSDSRGWGSAWPKLALTLTSAGAGSSMGSEMSTSTGAAATLSTLAVNSLATASGVARLWLWGVDRLESAAYRPFTHLTSLAV